jgi:hypothetical protein
VVCETQLTKEQDAAWQAGVTINTVKARFPQQVGLEDTGMRVRSWVPDRSPCFGNIRSGGGSGSRRFGFGDGAAIGNNHKHHPGGSASLTYTQQHHGYGELSGNDTYRWELPQ